MNVLNHFSLIFDIILLQRVKVESVVLTSILRFPEKTQILQELVSHIKIYKNASISYK